MTGSPSLAAAISPSSSIGFATTTPKAAIWRRRISPASCTREGAIDPAFAAAGVADVEVFGVARQADGKVVAAGRKVTGTARHSESKFLVFRLASDGSLDAAFAEGRPVRIVQRLWLGARGPGARASAERKHRGRRPPRDHSRRRARERIDRAPPATRWTAGRILRHRRRFRRPYRAVTPMQFVLRAPPRAITASRTATEGGCAVIGLTAQWRARRVLWQRGYR